MRREIVGRRAELLALGDLLEASGSPGFAALVIEGDPGIGKTTLWFEGVRLAREHGALVLAARPTASEARVPNSALGDLLRSLEPTRFEAIAEPLRNALRDAALLATSQVLPDERLVSRGLADLLLALAGERRLVVAIDDVQWLDERSRAAVAYALRRLVDAEARVLLARRPPAGASTALEDALPGTHVDLLSVGPLSLSALRDILLDRTGASLPRPLLVRVSRASGGNPYYALEIARELLRSGADAQGTLRLPGDVTRLTSNRILRLPEPTREALLLLALSSRPGADLAGLDLQPALDEGVVEQEQDGSVRFTHPLVATAVIDGATPAERRAAHDALASSADDEVEQARHHALAAVAPDLAAAAAAAMGYKLATDRGNAAAALEISELALQLTPRDEVGLRLQRARDYAECLDAAGAAADGRAVLEREIASAPHGDDRGKALVQLGWTCWRDDDLPSGIAACRRALEESDDAELHAEAYETLIWLYEDDLEQACESGRRLVGVRERQGDPVLLPRSRLLAAYFAIVAGHPPNREIVEADIAELKRQNVLAQNPVPEMWAKFTDRLDEARAILEQRLGFARDAHDEQFLVACLFALGEVDTWRGDFGSARATFDEALRLQDELPGTTYLGSLHACASQLAAIEGRLEDAERHAAEAVPVSRKAVAAAVAQAAVGFAAFAAGRLEDSDEAYSTASRLLDSIGMREPARLRYHGDHIEVLVLRGELERAASLTSRLAERLVIFQRPWLELQVHRGRALIEGAAGDLESALAAAQSARSAVDGLPMPFERARTDLVLGRLLRRAKRRGDARQALAAALQTFEALPAPRWAAATTEELARLGLSRAGDELTQSERAVAVAAAAGLKNREIAERLFMSPKTVEAHLSRTYRKLGVHSRAELALRLAAEG